jgi:hypothetical protein
MQIKKLKYQIKTLPRSHEAQGWVQIQDFNSKPHEKTIKAKILTIPFATIKFDMKNRKQLKPN